MIDAVLLLGDDEKIATFSSVLDCKSAAKKVDKKIFFLLILNFLIRKIRGFRWFYCQKMLKMLII